MNLNSDLLTKAQTLLSSDLFVSTTEKCVLAEKQNIFLVLAGMKPVGFVSSSHMSALADVASTAEADDPELVTSFLNSLGLHCSLFSDKYSTDATISLSQENLTELANNPNDHHLAGHLYGYPETAVAAFMTHDKTKILSEDEEEKVLKEAGIPECFPHFDMSKEHWAEEIKVIKNWYETCKEYGLG